MSTHARQILLPVSLCLLCSVADVAAQENRLQKLPKPVALANGSHNPDSVQTPKPSNSVAANGSILLDPIVLKQRRLQSGDSSEVFTGVGSSVYISPEARERFGAISAADMLKGQPGIQMGDSRNGGALDVNIRGIQVRAALKLRLMAANSRLRPTGDMLGHPREAILTPI